MTTISPVLAPARRVGQPTRFGAMVDHQIVDAESTWIHNPRRSFSLVMSDTLKALKAAFTARFAKASD